MNAHSHGPEPRDDVVDVARTLYEALIEARPYVFNRAAPEGVTSDDWRAATAAGVLERVDAALAEGGDYLTGG